MKLKYNISLLVICLIGMFVVTPFNAQDTRYVPRKTLASSVNKATNNTNFNGSVMISRTTNTGYDILYAGASGKNGGYSIDTVYDVGSVSKLYTTVAVLQLVEQGKLNLDDKITKFFDDVPAKKRNVTVEMLLTHTSGIYAPEDEDHNATKEEEIHRILASRQRFEPGTNYIYSNYGFTLLAAIIEEVSGMSYEDYMESNLFEPLGLKNTGFPSSDYMKDKDAVSGTLDGEAFGKVTDFDFGWWSKGYTDVLTTPRELTFFFQELIGGKILKDPELKKMATNEVNLGNDFYRGVGTDIKHPGKKTKIIGHTGIWYGGNSIVYYRPSDKILFVATCDELSLSGAYEDLPANHVFNTLSGMYPSGKLANQDAVSSIVLRDMEEPEAKLASGGMIPTYAKNETSSRNESNIDYLDRVDYLAEVKLDIKAGIKFVLDHSIEFIIFGFIFVSGMLGYVVYAQIKKYKAWRKSKKRKKKRKTTSKKSNKKKK